jgi:hypothetical protein
MGTPATLRGIARPVSSPRRLVAIPGQVITAKTTPPPPTLLTPLRGFIFSRRHPPSALGRGRILGARALPPRTSALLAPVNPVRIRARHRWRWAVDAAPVPPVTVAICAGIRPVASPRRLRPGDAIVAPNLPPTPTPGTPLNWRIALQVMPPRRGKVSPFRTLGPAAGPYPVPCGLSTYRPLHPDRTPPSRRRLVWQQRMAPPPDPISLWPHYKPVQIRGDQYRRRRRGWQLVNTPIPQGGALVGLGFHVYANTGVGDPINYVLPVATVFGLTWTSGPLAYPGDWKFGVRAFDSCGEEQNLDAAVELILDSGANDITRRPLPPAGLRAIAKAGGSIRVEWAYPSVNRAKLPTGFHVYTGTGGVPSYITPAATVAYSSGIAGTFSTMFTDLTDGATYTIGVRAFNGFAEEQNSTAVSVAADATGPLPVDSLSGTAI